MIEKLQAVNKYLVITTLGGLVVAILLQLLFVAPSQTSKEASAIALENSDKAVAQLRQRVAEIQRDGTAGVDALVSRLAAMERVLPLRSDDITVAGVVSRMAGQSGVKMNALDKSTDPVAVRGSLGYQKYDLRVRGASEQVSSFLSLLQSSSEVIITVARVEYSNALVGTADVPTDALSGDVEFNATLLVWSSAVPPLIPTAKTGDNTGAAPVTPEADATTVTTKP